MVSLQHHSHGEGNSSPLVLPAPVADVASCKFFCSRVIWHVQRLGKPSVRLHTPAPRGFVAYTCDDVECVRVEGAGFRDWCLPTAALPATPGDDHVAVRLPVHRQPRSPHRNLALSTRSEPVLKDAPNQGCGLRRTPNSLFHLHLFCPLCSTPL